MSPRELPDLDPTEGWTDADHVGAWAVSERLWTVPDTFPPRRAGELGWVDGLPDLILDVFKPIAGEEWRAFEQDSETCQRSV